MNRGQQLFLEWKGDRSFHDLSYDLRMNVESLRGYANGSAPNRQNALRMLEAAGIPMDAWDIAVSDDG